MPREMSASLREGPRSSPSGEFDFLEIVPVPSMLSQVSMHSIFVYRPVPPSFVLLALFPQPCSGLTLGPVLCKACFRDKIAWCSLAFLSDYFRGFWGHCWLLLGTGPLPVSRQLHNSSLVCRSWVCNLYWLLSPYDPSPKQ